MFVLFWQAAAEFEVGSGEDSQSYVFGAICGQLSSGLRHLPDGSMQF
jgi:hypothetical protein